MLSMSMMSAQSRGSTSFGATLGLTHIKYEIEDVEASNNSYGLAFNYEGFLTDKFSLGVDLQATQAKNEGIETTILTVMPITTCYIPISGNVYYAPRFGVGYAYTKLDYDDYSVDGGGIAFSASMLSFLFKTSSSFGIKVGFLDLGYLSTSLEYESVNVDLKAGEVSLALNPTVTLQWYL